MFIGNMLLNREGDSTLSQTYMSTAAIATFLNRRLIQSAPAILGAYPCSSILDKLGVESVEFTNFAALSLLSSTIHFSFKISRANKGFVCSITLSQVVSVLRVLRRYVTQSMRLRSPLLLQGFPLSVHRAFVEEEDCSRYMSQKEFADQCGATSIQRS